MAPLVACAESASLSPPRLVLLYATCSLNKEFLQPYDRSVAFTPHIAEFARNAQVFERHQTESGQSGTAFASIFSGLQAMDHGVYRHPTRLPDEILLITEAYAAAGYGVHSWLDHGMASAGLGYAQGVPPGNVHEGILRAGDEAFEAILRRLGSDADHRTFIVANFTVTHAPYSRRFLDEFCGRFPGECPSYPEGSDAISRYADLHRGAFRALQYDFDRAVRALGLSARDVERLIEVTETLYKSNVFHLDRLFGGLLERLAERGLLDASLIAFTSDHGEILYREPYPFHWTHGLQLAPEVLNVALLLHGPRVGVRPGRFPGVSRSIDVFPTLAGLSDVPLEGDVARGVDLSAAVRGDEPAPELVAYSHTALYADVVLERYRRFGEFARRLPENDPELIWTASRRGDEWLQHRRAGGDRWATELIDLRRGSGGFENRFDPENPRHREMADRLADYKTRLVAGYREREGVSREVEVELLRSLGYIER